LLVALGVDPGAVMDQLGHTDRRAVIWGDPGATVCGMRGVRPLTAVFSGVVVGAMGLILGGCGATTTRSNTAAVAQVTQAAYVTSQGPGFKMDMTLSGNIRGESFSLSTSGSYDEQGRRGAMSETVNGKTVATILDLPYGYVQAGGKLIKGKPWARFNVEGYAQSLGVSSSLNTSSDPTQWIDFLKAAGQASTVDSEMLRGVSTTHYHVLVDFARFPAVVPAPLRAGAQQEATLLKRISGHSSLPIGVWIDGQKRVRRYQVQVPLCFRGERTSESVSVELFDYGTQRVPAPPPLSEVSDLTSEVDSNASHALQQLSC
jgi:hypothetical protein